MSKKKIVYVLKEKDTTFYRIGSTHNMNERLKILHQGNPRQLQLIYNEEFDNHDVVNLMEIKLQKLFSKYRCKDSWYNVPHMEEIEIGYELKTLRMNYEMEELKKRQRYEKEQYWLDEYYKMKSKG